MKEEEISILDYLKVVLKHWKVICVIFVLGVGGALVFSMLSPKIYRAKATLLPQLPPSQQTPWTNIDIIPHLRRITPKDIFLAILKSRRMSDALIKEFNLMSVYNVKTMDDARLILQKDTTITSTKEGVIEVSVNSFDPNLSAALANAYLANLDKFNTEFITTAAKKARIFIANRLSIVKSELNAAEEALEAFRRKHGIIDIMEQSEAAISAAAAIEAEIAALEVQLKVMQDYTQASHPEISKLKLKIATLRKQLDEMEYSTNPESVYLPFKKLPRLGKQLEKLLREKKIQEALFNLLSEQYEQAKIDEARDTPTIQVLDEAIAPTAPYKPNLKLNIAISSLLSLFIGFFVAFFLEYIKRSQTT